MGDGDVRAGEGAGVGVVKGFAERREFQRSGSGGSGGRRGGAPWWYGGWSGRCWVHGEGVPASREMKMRGLARGQV